jgi:hypothetical protein
MSDFSVRADSVDIEQIMRQIRARIREKRGVDYTEEQIRELATAKLERFLDPAGVRSGLLEEFRRPTTPPPPLYAFEDTTLFESDKPLVRFFRRLLRPVLKLFFNPNVLSTVLHRQADLNQLQEERHALYYEAIHNLVLETTRAGIEVKSLKMRVESLQSRLEFNERRARALEGVVQYRPDALQASGRGGGSPNRGETDRTEPQGGVDPITGGESLRTRRRRRRRGRRGPGMGAAEGQQDTSQISDASPNHTASGPFDPDDHEDREEGGGAPATAANHSAPAPPADTNSPQGTPPAGEHAQGTRDGATEPGQAPSEAPHAADRGHDPGSSDAQ